MRDCKRVQDDPDGTMALGVSPGLLWTNTVVSNCPESLTSCMQTCELQHGVHPGGQPACGLLPGCAQRMAPGSLHAHDVAHAACRGQHAGLRTLVHTRCPVLWQVRQNCLQTVHIVHGYQRGRSLIRAITAICVCHEFMPVSNFICWQGIGQTVTGCVQL